MPNGGFEEYNKCPKNVSKFSYSKYWFEANMGTTDLFSTCNPPLVVKHAPHSGKAYAGIASGRKKVRWEYRNGRKIVLATRNAYYQEYIEVKLEKPLEAGKKYCLSMYVALDSNQYAAYNYLQFVLSKQKLNADHSEVIWPLKDTVHTIGNDSTLDDHTWTNISAQFIATGGEKFLTIGIFDPDITFEDLRSINPKANAENSFSYYFIDDVSLAAQSGNECACANPPLVQNEVKDTSYSFHLVKGETIVLKNIFFESGKSFLLPASAPELEALLKLLNENPGMKIEISGHTDNVGKEEDNLRLSEARAKAVHDYLVAKGIWSERLSFKGYGSSKPITPNDTPEDRAQNRRVEFKVVE
ncbi:MAG TPA: OmpA family protein [Bacteroidia bacterium]